MRAGSLPSAHLCSDHGSIGGAVGLLRGVALWAAGYGSCPCHAGITECHCVEYYGVVVACVAWFDVDGAGADFEVE